MYNKETYWFNQPLFSHKDKTEGTDSHLSVSTTTSSKDLTSIGQIFLSLRISNHNSKSCLLKYQDVIDLNSAFQASLKQDIQKLFDNSNDNPIIRRYQKNQDLIFEFKTNNNDQYVVKMLIRNSSTDFAMIVFPASILKVMIQIFSNFRDQYSSYISMMEQKLVVKRLESLQRLEIAIKGLYSRNVSQDNIQDNGAPEPEQPQTWAGDMTEELDKFLGNGMQNIDLPEEVEKIDEEAKDEKPKQEINSAFMERIGFDMEKLELELKNRSNIIEYIAGLENDLGFEILPGISEKEKKSIAYLTTLFYHVSLQDYTINGSKFPSTFPIIKYEIKEEDKRNFDLAIDLLIAHCFFRSLRRRVENYIPDPRKNYTLTYLVLRMFTDPLVYGHLHGKDANQVASIAKNRFSLYKNKGAFDNYSKVIKTYNLPEVTEDDIEVFVNEVFSVGLNRPYVVEFHDKAYADGGLRLESNNSVSLEQIINEVVPTEVKEKLGSEINIDELSPEIKEIFSKKLEKKKKTTKKKNDEPQMNPLQMFVKKFKVEVPDDVTYNSLFSYVKDFSDKPLDLTDFPFDIKDLGENLLKGLYFWDPEKHKNMNQLKGVIDDPMTKDLIISKVKSDVKVDDNKSAEWAFAMDL